MKRVLFGLLILSGCGLLASAAFANDVMVASAMQRCTMNEECTLITNSCADNCGFVPVNKLNLETLKGVYQQRCGKPMEANPQCNMNPPISAACINNRCTIDYAYAHHAGAKDYKPGAYPVPEAPVPDQAPASAAPADDRQGFTAYDLPQGTVHQKAMGQIVDKVYVPPSAPVSGGNYVPVNQGQQAQTQATAPQQPAAPAAPPATAAPYAPTQESYATPPVAVPTAPQPSATGVVMPPSQPRRIPPQQPQAAIPPQPVPQPTTTTTPAQIATPSDPIPSSAPDTIKEPRAPSDEPVIHAPSPDTGNPNAPVPPSDFKEKPLAPPPGATVPVGPDDPGAVPPPNVVLQPPVPAGEDDEAKSFGTTTQRQDATFN